MYLHRNGALDVDAEAAAALRHADELLKQLRYEKARDARRAAEEAERVAAAEREAAETRRREQAYAIAANAALRWTGWPTLRPDVIARQRHVVDRALFEEPALRIHWLSMGCRSEELVGRSNALALMGTREVVVHPVVSAADEAVALHEIGHHRTWNRTKCRLRLEADAWRWARQHALEWTELSQANMVQALQSYVNATTKRSEVVAVLEVEQLCSPLEFRQEQQRRLELRLAAEDAQRAALLEGKTCTRCHSAAETFYARTPYCFGCAAHTAQQIRDQILDSEIAHQRRRREEMKRR